MVSRSASAGRRRERGVIIAELVVAVSLLLLAVLPISVAFFREQAGVRALYQRTVAMEIVDGEMEALVAGAWRACPPGRHVYAVRAEATKVLPPGEFILTRTSNRLRLEWLPKTRGAGGPFAREIQLQSETPASSLPSQAER